MQNTLKFIDSLTNDSINKIRNSKSDAEARRILKETNAEFLQSCVVEQSEQLCECDFCNNKAIKRDDDGFDYCADCLQA
jgi:ribosomal protein L37AE/L43A